MTTPVLLLLLAHLLGDFWLQPRSWVDARNRLGWSSRRFWQHLGVHAALVYTAALLLVAGAVLAYGQQYAWADHQRVLRQAGRLLCTNALLLALAVAALHGAIDLLKARWVARWGDNSRLFLVDQAAHLGVLLGLSPLAAGFLPLAQLRPAWASPWAHWESLLAIVVGAVLLTRPTGLGLKLYLKNWRPRLVADPPPPPGPTARSADPARPSLEPEPEETQGLLGAGMLIGQFERLIIFAMVLVDGWSVLGFVVAAKALLRLNDLRGQAPGRALTEYILLGSLASWLLALLVGLGVKGLL